MKKKILQILSLILVGTQLLACSPKKESVPEESSIRFENAPQIVSLTERFVTQFPFRKAGSAAHAQAGQWIAEQLASLGYQVQAEQGLIKAQKQGKGFYRTEEQAKDAQGQLEDQAQIGAFRKTIVLMAAYDTSVGEEQRAEYQGFQGVSETGASVGTLLKIAENLASKTIAYDVQFVFLGDSQGQKSARAYVQSLTEEAKQHIEVVMDIGSIYAGSKLYAHAGRQSALEGNKYEYRKALYHTIDLFTLYNLVYVYNMNLFTVQNQFSVTVPNFNQQALYREFSLKDGNYLPFDEQKIPVVFFDAGDYRIENLEEMKENTSAHFESVSGQVSGSSLDYLEFLKEKLPEEQLEKRVDILSRLIEFYIINGIYNASMAE